MNNLQHQSFLIPIEKCQLCQKKKQQFTCNVCVLTGNFSHSNSDVKNLKKIEISNEGNYVNEIKAEDNSVFSSKQRRLQIVKNVTKDFQKRLEEKICREAVYSEKVKKLILLRNQIDSLKIVLREGKERIEREREENSKLASDIAEKQKLVQRLSSRSEKIRNSHNFAEKKMKLERYKRKLQTKEKSLKEVRISRISHFIGNIFPLSERTIFPTLGTSPRGRMNLADSGSDVISEALSKSPEFDLEEATRTIHVEGKWISFKSEETETTIVDVGMPNSGDFYKYFVWLKSYQSEPRSTESNVILHHYEILDIPAALIYSAQLANGLAYFLDVNLPNRIEYLNFGLLQVSRKKLVRTINNLAENVVYLCCSQGLDKELLEPRAILKNLKLLIESNCDGLGSSLPFETIEFEPNECPFDSDSSAEELNFDTDTEDGVGGTEEWDRLPDIPTDSLYQLHRDHSISPSFEENNSHDRTTSLSSSASGLVTSAAASVASALWSWKR